MNFIECIWLLFLFLLFLFLPFAVFFSGLLDRILKMIKERKNKQD